VDVVVDYYWRWFKTFPTVRSLARAPYHRVLKHWEGLGYYTRASNLHRAAKIAAATGIPHDAKQLQSLPGIGRYTAGAIASIAFGERVPLVDGNVARVFARIFNIRASIKLPATQKKLWSLAASLLPATDCGDFSQALMELGALVCLPLNPRCDACPMRRVCAAPTDDLPNRGVKRSLLPVTQTVVFVQRAGRVLLRRRPTSGQLAGLWELPALAGEEKELLLTHRHTITQRRITLRVVVGKPQRTGVLRWVTPSGLARLTLPAAHRLVLARLHASH
jgi:A/G-specific adenine glycosylase